MCYINGRIDPTQFFYNLMVVFDSQPDLHSLKRSIEQHVAEDGVCTDGGDFIVSEIEILDFRTNMWVNLESRAQLYSGCHLTAIRSLMGASCSGTIDRSRKTSLQRVLGFALDAQRIFEVLDIDDEGKIRLKGLLRVLRQDVDYAVDVFSFLDKSSEGQVSFQVFLQSFNDFSNRPFFDELQRRIAVGGKRIDTAASSSEGGSAGGERSSHHRSGDASPTSSSAGIAIPPRASLPVIVTDAGNQESTAAQVLTDEEKAKALRVVEMFKSSAKKVSSSTGGEGGGDPKVSQGVMNRLKNLARSKAAASAGNSTSPGGSQLPSSSPHVAAASSSPFGPIASSTASTASSGSKKASGAVK